MNTCELKGFKLSELFAEVFARHSREEIENYFTTGTEKSTPSIHEVNASWPKPWLFMRMAIASLIIFFLFWAGWKQFTNPNLLPGLMMVGSFAIPISTLVLFMELNVRRNVSLYMVARLAFLGGILSLLITLVIDNLGSCGLLPNYGFFSSHASNTFSLAIFFSLLVRSRVLTTALIIWSLINCWTRMYLGVHYPLDIMCGLLWGSLVGTGIWFLHQSIRKRMGNTLGFISSQYTTTGYQLSDVNVVISIMVLTLLYSIFKSCFMILF